MSNNRFDISVKDLTDNQMNILNILLNEQGATKASVFKFLLDSHIKHTDKTGMRDATHDKIDIVVKHQMQINATTDKTVTVGLGEKAKQVKYEQRALTPKWIMDNAQAQFDSTAEYLRIHRDEINRHHKEVLGFDADITEINSLAEKGNIDAIKLQNLNRSTAKAWYSVQIAELVKRTGGNKNECEQALKFNDWNADKSFEFMQKLGQVK
jgi:hypothetical protein